ncbi:MAG: hypothetical protein ACOH2A_04855 [Sphingobacteriaceae bacterium]
MTISEKDFYSPVDEIDLTKVDETDHFKAVEDDDDRSDNEIATEDENEFTHPEEDKHSGSGINFDANIAERSKGRIIERMIDHEPGTPGI